MKYNNQQRKSKLASAGSFAFWTLALGYLTGGLVASAYLAKDLMKSIVKDTNEIVDDIVKNEDESES